MYETEMKNFLDADGRLKQFPAKRKMQVYALLFLSSKLCEQLNPESKYLSIDITAIIHKWCAFDDPATMRRELVDAGILSRTPDGREYWLHDPQPAFEDFNL